MRWWTRGVRPSPRRLALQVQKQKFQKCIYFSPEFLETTSFRIIIGPRGRTQRELEAETGALIHVLGKGTGTKRGGKPRPGDDDDPHVLITASSEEILHKAGWSGWGWGCGCGSGCGCEYSCERVGADYRWQAVYNGRAIRGVSPLQSLALQPEAVAGRALPAPPAQGLRVANLPLQGRVHALRELQWHLRSGPLLHGATGALGGSEAGVGRDTRTPGQYLPPSGIRDRGGVLALRATFVASTPETP